MDAEIMSGASAEPANVAATGVVPEVQEVHRVLTLDRTEGTDVSRHILLPVDDTDVSMLFDFDKCKGLVGCLVILI